MLSGPELANLLDAAAKQKVRKVGNPVEGAGLQIAQVEGMQTAQEVSAPARLV